MSGRGLLIPMPTTLLARALMLALVGGGVLLAAAVVTPRGSEARSIEQAPAPAETFIANERAIPQFPAYMGTLHGVRYNVDVFMGRKGPEFTVKDLDGNVLAQGLTSDELRDRYPQEDPDQALSTDSAYVEAPAESLTNEQAAEPVEDEPLSGSDETPSSPEPDVAPPPTR